MSRYRILTMCGFTLISLWYFYIISWVGILIGVLEFDRIYSELISALLKLTLFILIILTVYYKEKLEEKN